MDAPITLNPILPADACGYQTWMVALPCGSEVAVCANSEEAAIKVWRFAGAYAARPMRQGDIGSPGLRGTETMSSRFD